MNFTICPAGKQHASGIFRLINALALFERAPEEVTLPLAQFEEDGFGENPAWKALVALDGSQNVIGFALWYLRYSTWKGRRLYLEDLYVEEEWRRAGVASALMEALQEEARKAKCNGLVWQVLDWNVGAKKFYEKLGAQFDAGWENVSMPV
jgi:GNAT superfamily N-acetyltransferase